MQARLSRFTGASAISSADFYGNGEGGGGSGGPARSGSDFDLSANELMNKLSFQVPISPLLRSLLQNGHSSFLFPVQLGLSLSTLLIMCCLVSCVPEDLAAGARSGWIMRCK